MYRIGQEEIDAVARVIRAGELFKVNGGALQETKNAEAELCEKLNTLLADKAGQSVNGSS